MTKSFDDLRFSEFYGELPNYVGNKYVTVATDKFYESYDPGTGKVIAKVPETPSEEIERAIEVAYNAFEKWSRLPIYDRLQYLVRLKILAETYREDYAKLLSQSVGKTLREARGELFRAIQAIDSALGSPHLFALTRKIMNIAKTDPEIDMEVVREPLGVFTIISPFNFPIMIPMWFIPWAVTLGNTVIVKPSEQDPTPLILFARLFREAGYPEGVVNVINGGGEVARRLIAHKDIVGVAFVGSTAVGEKVYVEAAQHGKRALAQTSAKNPVVVMPDADVERSIENFVGGFFDMAGQRCLAPGLLILVGEAYDKFLNKIIDRVKKIRVNYQLLEDTDMGPVISSRARERIIKMINRAEEQGAKILIDGRLFRAPEPYKEGFYLGPTVLLADPDMEISHEEIFGPVMPIVRAKNFDEAIEIANTRKYGNTGVIFTSSGKYAREFARRVNAGNIGINVAVAQPDQFFPFPGRKRSFFGVLHGQVDAIDFFTDRKVIIQRWW
jgi:malonate-semialdehyde dehydrogenase (acetylating)/methylmalonate-semialdehyde dehydrogenase